MAELRAGNAIYLHSAQGHGRAGTFVALLLSTLCLFSCLVQRVRRQRRMALVSNVVAVRLYGVSVEEALTKSCHYHDYRIDNGGKASPTTLAQFEQVRREGLHHLLFFFCFVYGTQVRRLHPHLIAMYQKDMSVLVPMLGSASQPSQLSTPQS